MHATAVPNVPLLHPLSVYCKSYVGRRFPRSFDKGPRVQGTVQSALIIYFFFLFSYRDPRVTSGLWTGFQVFATTFSDVNPASSRSANTQKLPTGAWTRKVSLKEIFIYSILLHSAWTQPTANSHTVRKVASFSGFPHFILCSFKRELDTKIFPVENPACTFRECASFCQSCHVHVPWRLGNPPFLQHDPQLMPIFVPHWEETLKKTPSTLIINEQTAQESSRTIIATNITGIMFNRAIPKIFISAISNTDVGIWFQFKKVLGIKNFKIYLFCKMECQLCVYRQCAWICIGVVLVMLINPPYKILFSCNVHVDNYLREISGSFSFTKW